MVVISFDLSLSSTGWCVSAGAPPPAIEWGVFTPPSKHDLTRIDYLARQCAECARPADLVVMEDFAFGSRDAYAREIAGLSYMVRHWLWKHNKPLVLVAPASLKKFATGKGNAEKSLVLKTVYQKWGSDCGNDNEADAVALAHIGLTFAGIESPRNEPERQVCQMLQLKNRGLWENLANLKI